MEGYKVFKFPAGEVQVICDYNYNSSVSRNLTKRIRSSDDIIELLQIADIQIADIKKHETGDYPSVYIPYLPFSRMDRRINNDAFSLKVFADIINTAKFKQVSSLDVHSNVAELLIDNFVNRDPFTYQVKFMKSIDVDDLNTTLIIPDFGAAKRYPNLNYLFSNNLVQCGKVRNGNGEIIKSEVYGNVEGRNCIVFDDICDGGATFIGIAEELKKRGAKKLFLFVTHGIFSKGLTELFKWYDVIGCTNSYCDYDFAMMALDNFKVIKI